MPPAGALAALVVFVQFALETVQDVIDRAEPGLLKGRAGISRAIATAANQHNRPVDAGGLLDVSDEVGVDLPIRAIVPGNHDGTHWMPHKQELHLAPNINEQRQWIFVQEYFRFFGSQVVHLSVREAVPVRRRR